MAGVFKLDSGTKRELEELGRQEADRLANDAKDKLTKKYISLITDYYNDYTPKRNKYGKPYYVRTENLYRSYMPYKRNSGNHIFYGGVQISDNKMHDYKSLKGETFTAERLLEKYIYTATLPSATWHGGDWHGGYGVMADFSIYDEMMRYRDDLISYYIDNFSTK